MITGWDDERRRGGRTRSRTLENETKVVSPCIIIAVCRIKCEILNAIREDTDEQKDDDGYAVEWA